MSTNKIIDENFVAVDSLAKVVSLYMNRVYRHSGLPMDTETMALLVGQFQLYLLESGFFLEHGDLVDVSEK